MGQEANYNGKFGVLVSLSIPRSLAAPLGIQPARQYLVDRNQWITGSV